MKKEDNMRSVLGQNLIKYRKAQNMTQEELAKKSGVARRVIAYYETQDSNPPLDNLQALTSALNISIAQLISEQTDEDLNLFKDIDTRTLKKIMLINQLDKKDRTMIYNIIDALLEKKKSNSN